MADPDTAYTPERVQRMALDLSTRMKLPHLYEADFDDETEERIPPSPDVLRRSQVLTGAIGIACGMLIDDLFDDIVALHDVEGPLMLPDDLQAFHELPPAYVDHYDPAFLRRFLTVTVDLSRQFLGEWAGLTCVAQELAMRLALNRVAALADQWDLDLEPDWHGIATEKLFWDIDHEFLYTGDYLSMEKSGLAEEMAMSNMWVGHWFEPFNDEGIVNMYANTLLEGASTDPNGTQDTSRG